MARRSALLRVLRIACALSLAVGAMAVGPTPSAAQTPPDPAAADDVTDPAPFKTEATLVSMPPTRFADSRPGFTTFDGQFQAAGKRAADSEYKVQITGRNAIPADAVAVVMNVTAVEPEAGGYVTVHSCVTPRPFTSALNYVPGVDIGNEIIAGLAADGSVCIYNLRRLHLTVDVVGYVPATSRVTPLVTARLLDTRPSGVTVDGAAQGIGRTLAGSTTKVKVTGRAGIPDGVKAIIANLTAVNPTRSAFVSAHPCLATKPTWSSLNYIPGVDRGNEIIIEVNASGEVCFYTEVDLDLTLDVVGFIPPETNVKNVTPARIAETRPGFTTIDGLFQAEGKRAANSTYKVRVAGRAGVPPNATAAIINLTAVSPEAGGYFTAHPCVDPPPNASSLNYIPGVDGGNELIVDLDANGDLCVFARRNSHLTIDVTGYLVDIDVATSDSYSTFGNTLLEVGVPAGAAPAVRVAGNVLANDAGDGALSVTTFDSTSTLGGTVAMSLAGAFSYTPPACVTSTTDTFTYTVGVNGVPSDIGTVSIALSQRVWYVDNTSAAATKTGTSNASFATLAAAQAASGAGDTIFVDAGNGTAAGYDQGITLAAGQRLVGEATGLTVDGVVLVPPGAKPKLSAAGALNTVTLGSGGSVSGMSLAISGSGAAIRSAGAGAAVSNVDVTANSEGIRLDGASGTFTFDGVSVNSAGGSSLHISGGAANVTFTNSSVTQTGPGAGIEISSHAGVFTFGATNTLNATNGTGLQFDNADGTYTFQGVVTLNGGDAGIDILNGSAGTFTFPATTTITNPTGVGVNIQDFEAPASFIYNGSVTGNLDVFLAINTTAPGTSINFNTTGANSLTSTDNPNGGILLFDLNVNLTITTPTTIVRPTFSALFATSGSGVWSFTDFTVTDQSGLNGGIDVFGQSGTINFTNVNVTTDSAGTGDATTGFLMGGNNIVNVMGNSSVNADGGGALVLVNVNTINMTFQSLTSTNNLSSQIGFSGDDGIDILNVDAGSLTVTGTTTVTNADGVGISVEGSGFTSTFTSVALGSIGLEGVIAGVASSNTGTLNINGGTIANTGTRGMRLGSTLSGGQSAGTVNVNNVAFSAIGSFVVRTANSTLSGSGNTATPFSCDDVGGNTGTILFNGGVDSCP